jgi:two-component system, NarL family, response regulator NreC
MTIRILLADDHTLLRAGLRALLQTEACLEVIGEASDGNEVLQLVEKLHPDVVVMDISMPGRGGIETTRMLQKVCPEIHILILTVHEDGSLLQEVIRAGASGYILKRALESELINAIHAVARGDLYIHPSMTRSLILEQEPKPVVKLDSINSLTAREIEVVRLLANGYTNRQIADLLNISVRTVESHRANLMNKLGMTHRADLVRYAAQNNLLSLENS